MSNGSGETIVVVIEDRLWREDGVDKVDLSGDPGDCADPTQRDTANDRVVLFQLKGPPKPVKVCFDGDVPFKNWSSCEEKPNGTLVGVVDAPPGEYKYSVYVDGDLICDPIIWVQ